MRAVNFPEANVNLTKPDSMTDEECYGLSALVGMMVLENGKETPYAITKWMPSKEDIEAINAGRGVYLKQVGGHNPCAIFTMNENGESNDL